MPKKKGRVYRISWGQGEEENFRARVPEGMRGRFIAEAIEARLRRGDDENEAGEGQLSGRRTTRRGK